MLVCILCNMLLEKAISDAELKNGGPIFKKSSQISDHVHDLDLITKHLKPTVSTKSERMKTTLWSICYAFVQDWPKTKARTG